MAAGFSLSLGQLNLGSDWTLANQVVVKTVSLGGRLGSKGQSALAYFTATEIPMLHAYSCTSTSHYCEDTITLEPPSVSVTILDLVAEPSF